jgi:hypothetical protein
MAHGYLKRNRIISATVFPLLYALIAFAMPGGVLPAAAQAPAALSEAQDVNGAPGLVAEIVQCKRENGVLSIRMRLRNTGGKRASVLFRVTNDRFYVTAGSKKYFVLRDSEKTPLATLDDSTGIEKGATFAFYAKYLAPPAEVKKITFYTPFTAPFEDIPITD